MSKRLPEVPLLITATVSLLLAALLTGSGIIRTRRANGRGRPSCNMSRAVKFWHSGLMEFILSRLADVNGNAAQVEHEGDITELRDALLRTHKDTALRQLYAGRGLSRISEKYSILLVASRYRRLMRSISE
jgi:hypothetical protein